jgi:hypothetical protein
MLGIRSGNEVHPAQIHELDECDSVSQSPDLVRLAARVLVRSLGQCRRCGAAPSVCPYIPSDRVNRALGRVRDREADGCHRRNRCHKRKLLLPDEGAHGKNDWDDAKEHEVGGDA